MLRGQVGRQWRGTYDLHFDHHDSIKTLKASHGMGCGICQALYEELMAGTESNLGLDYKIDKERTPDESGDNEAETALSGHSTALLGVIHDIEDDDVFRLDFKLDWILGEQTPRVMRRTFALKQIGTRLELKFCIIILNMSYRQPHCPIQNSLV